MTATIVGPGGEIDVSDQDDRELGRVTVINTGDFPGAGGLTDAELRASAVTVDDGHPDPLTDTQLRAADVPVADDYTGGEVLADQAGAGAVLTFTFTSDVNLVLVEADGDDVRVDPFGGTPTSAAGIRGRDATPTYLPVTTGEVKVWAPSGATVTVAGFRRS